MGCHKLTYYEQDTELKIVSCRKALTLNKSKLKGSSTYLYGYQGQEEDSETGFINYKYRMHDPRIGRFFAVDPLAKSFPWNSPYAFAENDVIRSIDLDGLEKLGVTDSYYNALRIKSLFKVKNYRKIYEIIDYGSKNPWVSDGQKQSDYIYRKNLELNGSDNLISKGRSGTILDIPTDAEKVREFGDINDHGGYMEVEFYDYRTKKSTNLGTLPLSKMKEHSSFTIYKNNNTFWDVDPVFNNMDKLRESGNRIINLIPDIATLLKMPTVIDVQQLAGDKAIYQIKGRLRNLGANSAFEVALYKNNLNIGSYQIKYEINKKGKETFTESFVPRIE